MARESIAVVMGFSFVGPQMIDDLQCIAGRA